MAFEMPLDQIKQLQVTLRKQANLSWYQPENDEDHFTLPKLPSVSETIAKLDPSPPYLRCKNCNGRLLRGLQSSICVFCGTNPHKDLPPDPIKFNKTLGYQWLLESLQLNGSEMVAPMVEENASSRGRNESEDEIPLSELLDLEIRWPSEAERSPSGNSDGAAFRGKSSLNLAGVDLDSFFVRRESDSDAFEQNLGSGKQVGTASDNNDFQANENLSLFQNVQALEVATGSTEDQSGFSGWEANFKSASSGPVREESKSVDHSKVDLDMVSGSSKDSVGVKKNDDFNPSASAENDCFQGGWRTSNSEVPSQAGKSDLTVDLNDTKTAGSANGLSTRNFEWMQDDQWQGSGNKTTGTVATDEADDSFDAWNDFTGSASTQDPSNIISGSHTTDQTGKSEITVDLSVAKTAEGASSSGKDFEWMQHDQGRDSNNKTTDTIGTHEAADSFDAWNDFTGSASSVSNSEITDNTGKFELTMDANDIKAAESATGSSRNFEWMQEDQWQGSNDQATDIVTANEVADSFDAWNDFTGSAITQNSSSSVSKSQITGHTGKSEITADLNDINTTEGANTSVKNFDWMQDDKWQVSNNKTTDTVTTNEVVDSFDDWNGFTSSATMQDASSNVWKQTVNQTSAEQMTGMNLFSKSNNSNDMDFSGFSQHDLFLGQFSSPLSSPAATNAQSATASSSNRVADVDATGGNLGDASIAKVGSKVDDVEVLMSQMHDLSFMLESNLSIPPK